MNEPNRIARSRRPWYATPQIRAFHCSFRVSDKNNAIRSLGDFRQQRIGERRLALEVPPATSTVLRPSTATFKALAWPEVMIPAAT